MVHEKILLIDDDIDDHMLFTEAVSEVSTATECIIAHDGIEALSLLKSVKPVPSLIFLDLNMPMMNGFECLNEIRKEDDLKKIPVVIFTTSNNPRDQKQAEEMGAELLLTKVSNYDQLKERLYDILRQDFPEHIAPAQL